MRAVTFGQLGVVFTWEAIARPSIGQPTLGHEHRDLLAPEHAGHLEVA
jgi:hypothetical protein